MVSSDSTPPSEAPGEDALARSQRRLSLVLAATSEGLWEWDIVTGEVTWSERALSMLGYDRESFQGTLAFVRELIHPNDREAFETALAESADGAPGHDLDLRFRMADGAYRVCRTRAMVLRGPDGKATRAVGSIADVTDIRRQARLLERTESVGRIGGWELQAGSREMYFSAGTYRVLDVDPSSFALTFEALALLFPETERAQLRAAVDDALAHGTPWDLELLRRSKLGASFIRITARADVERGTTTRLFGTMQDVTARRLSEDALRDSVADRVRTLDALRESLARYRLLVENSQDLVMEVETDGHIVYASPNFEPELGLPPSYLVRKNLLDHLHVEDRDRVRALLQRPAARFGFRHRHANGSYLWLEANANRFSTSAGEAHSVLVCRDVTERTRSEQLARESANLFKKAFRASPNANSITDISTGEVLEANEGFFSFFGYSREEAIGRTTTELGIWPDPRERDRFVGELRRAGSVRDFRAALRIRSGEERLCLTSAETLEIGGKKCLIGVVVDITEREEAERTLRESEEKFSLAFRLGPNAMAIANLEDNAFIDVNENFERIVGLSRDEIIGRKIGDLGRMSDGERARLFRALTNSGSARNMEAEFIHPDGEPGWVLVSGEITSFRGKAHLLFSLHDISERRRMELAKAALEDQLRHVQKMEAIGTLAGGIAHDFNNILGAMLAYTEIARFDAASHPAIVESLGEVKKAGARAKELVQQILTFSRHTPNERKPTRLQPIVSDAHKLLRSTLPVNIQLVLKVSEDAGSVAADSTQLHQVLVNLCTNAAHALNGEPGEIVIRLAPYETHGSEGGLVPKGRGGQFVQLSVSDTGQGMDAPTMERIFEPFFTTKKPGEGTGLGLAVVHGIVKDHGGVIHVESEPGRGTTFHVLLPVRASSTEDAVAENGPLKLGHGEHILFIDDEPMLCIGAKKLLEKLNYVVTTETSAPSAVTRFKANPHGFDLVVTDLTMPAMSGVEVAAELLRVRPGTKVVLATGFNANLTMDTVRTLGILDLVAKPLSVAELAETVHAALRAP